MFLELGRASWTLKSPTMDEALRVPYTKTRGEEIFTGWPLHQTALAFTPSGSTLQEMKLLVRMKLSKIDLTLMKSACQEIKRLRISAYRECHHALEGLTNLTFFIEVSQMKGTCQEIRLDYGKQLTGRAILLLKVSQIWPSSLKFPKWRAHVKKLG